jgi:hypothetical protein
MHPVVASAIGLGMTFALGVLLRGSGSSGKSTSQQEIS